MGRPILTAEVSYLDSSASPQAAIEYCSSEGFTTASTDTPANQFFNGRLTNDGSYRNQLGARQWAAGATISIGSVNLANADGELDDWRDFEFKNQNIILKLHDSDAAYSAATTLVTGKIERVKFDNEDIVRVVIRDPLQLLDEPLNATSYDSSPETDAQGLLKPIAFGGPRLCEPVLVDANTLTYHCSDVTLKEIAAVYDRGVEVSWTPLDPLVGFTLDQNPDGKITADILTSGTGSDYALDTEVTAGTYTDQNRGFQNPNINTDPDNELTAKGELSRNSSGGGKYYFEVLVDHAAIGSISYGGVSWDVAAGIGPTALSNPDRPDNADQYSLLVDHDTTGSNDVNFRPYNDTAAGSVITHTGTSSPEDPWPGGTDYTDPDGSIIGVLVNFDDMQITYYWNNTSLSGPHTINTNSPETNYFPIVASSSSGAAINEDNKVTLYQMADQLSYSLPAGYSAWGGAGIVADTGFNELRTELESRVPGITFATASPDVIDNYGYTYGYYFTKTVTAVDVLSAAVSSFGGYFYINRSGDVAVGRLEAPATTADLAIDDYEIVGDISMVPDYAPRLTNGIGAIKSWSPYDVDNLASSLTEDQKATFSREFQSEYRTSQAVHDDYSGSVGADLLPTLFLSAADAVTEADRINFLYAVQRRFFVVPIAVNPDRFDNFIDALGQTITINSPRFNLSTTNTGPYSSEWDSGFDSSGDIPKFRLVGIEGNLLTNQITLRIWG